MTIDLRPQVAVRDGWVCRYCGVDLVPSDHPEVVCQWVSERIDYWWLDADRGSCGCGEHPRGVPCVLPACWRVPSGYEWPTADHVVPVSRGGLHRFDNVVLACNRCNARKGARTEVEYREWMMGRSA